MSYHTIFANNNKVFVFGYNEFGQLGLGHNDNQCTPQILELESESEFKSKSDEKPVQIACGGSHTILLMNSGRIFGFGSNKYGQLGLDNFDNQNKPLELTLDGAAKQVACGYYHTAILMENNEIFVFGKYDLFNCGQQKKPRKIILDKKIMQLCCGSASTVLLTESAEILIYRQCDNIAQQLKFDEILDGKLNETIIQIVCGDEYIMLLCQSGNVFVFKYIFCGPSAYSQKYSNIPQLLSLNERVIQIACSNSHYMLITESGNVYGFGCNESGQLGLGHRSHYEYDLQKISLESYATEIACGIDHTIVSTESGKIFVFGGNDYGQLGLGHIDNNNHHHTNHTYTPQLLPLLPLMKSTLLMNNMIKEWSPLNHQNFILSVRSRIFTFLSVNKVYDKLYNLNIPKFVRFEIIKNVV